MSAGKLLTQPLLVALVVALICWFVLHRVIRGRGQRRERVAWGALGLSLAALWLCSLPVIANALEESLIASRSATNDPPEAIVVLAGGYAPGRRHLSSDTIMRVLSGVEWWKRHPDALLIMSGEAPNTEDFPSMTAQMADIGLAFGVPAEKILLEQRSANTMQHPVEVARLPGIDRETQIGVVTSRWHQRRAMGEFALHFESVQQYPHPVSNPAELGWQDWLPSADALGQSTRMVHDWIGIAWYRLLHALEESEGQKHDRA